MVGGVVSCARCTCGGGNRKAGPPATPASRSWLVPLPLDVVHLHFYPPKRDALLRSQALLCAFLIVPGGLISCAGRMP